MVVAMLDWQQAAVLAGALVLVAGAAAACPERHVRALRPFALEGAIVAALYSLWQLAGELSLKNTAGAFTRARWVVRAEHDVRLPSEADLQRPLLEHAGLAHVLDLYYATMHFSVMGVFLIWLFLRHRDRYRPVRRVLAVVTLLCLLVQIWLPIAPPRLLHHHGFVDIALKYGQSVYGTGFDADQLSAMPSVHVAWAALVGVSVWRISTSRWRFVGPLHFAVTMFVVVSTANHFWADGIVALALLALSWCLVRTAVALTASVRTGVSAPVPAQAPPVPSVVEPV